MNPIATNSLSSMAPNDADVGPDDSSFDPHEVVRRLYPLLRTSVGPSFGRSLRIVGEYLPISIDSVPSGRRVGDWIVPNEWELDEAYVEDPDGRRRLDVADHSLRIVNGSTAVDLELPFERLRERLHVHPSLDDAIPYRTAYYEPSWGFCLSRNELRALEASDDGRPWRAVIRSRRSPGRLEWGSLVLPGRQQDEIVFSAHLCHPSLANDNLSGIAAAIGLARRLMTQERRWTYRFLFLPGTIGPIAWWSKEARVGSRTIGGAVLSMVGDDSPLRYRCSLTGESLWDRACRDESSLAGHLEPFAPDGYDERQWNSAGIGMPIGRFSRADWATWPRYHGSFDDLSACSRESIESTIDTLACIVRRVESRELPRATWGPGEPRLGRHGLWNSPIFGLDDAAWRRTVGWLGALADGRTELAEIARRSGTDESVLREVAIRLSAFGLLDRGEGLPAVTSDRESVANPRRREVETPRDEATAPHDAAERQAFEPAPTTNRSGARPQESIRRGAR